MSRNPKPSSSNTISTQRVRSRTGRIITWSFIFVMLIIIGIEAQSQFGHSSSISQLRQDIGSAENQKVLSLAEAQQRIRGFAFLADGRRPTGGRVTYRWPSLFRSYLLQLVVNGDGDVITMNTEAVDDADNKPMVSMLSAEQKIALMPRPGVGIANPLQGTIALQTNDVEPRMTQAEYDVAKLRICRGALVRELIRQAFLLSAQEELQQNVRDESLGDDVGRVQKPGDFPYEVHSEINPAGVLTIEIVKYHPTRATYRHQVPPFQLSPEEYYESLLEHVESLARSVFPKLLRETGIVGTPNTIHQSAPVPPEIDELVDDFNEMSQLAAVRELHALMRRDGESPQRLATLSRAYANLGSLTEFHWRPHSKVFKARALLYAQRLVAVDNASPSSLAHRGYAWTLVGRPISGLADFKRAAGAKLATAADWAPYLVAARASCGYHDANDADADQDDVLATYLHLLSTDPFYSQGEYLQLSKKFLEKSPGCARAQYALAEVPELGIQRVLAEGFLQASWPALYQSLLKVPGLPQDAVSVIQAQSASPRVRADEPEERVKLIRTLQAVPHDGPGPGVAVYGELLDELSFIHAVFRVKILESVLGLPADQLVQSLGPTIDGHPFAAYIHSCVSQPTVARAEFRKVMGALRPIDLDLNARPLLSDASRWTDPLTYSKLYRQAVSHHDLLQWDLIHESQYDPRISSQLAILLNETAPQLPQSIAQRIRTLGPENDEEANDLESRYKDNALVLQALGEWHTLNGRYKDAERCLNRRIEIAPEVDAYRSLANVYASNADREKWKETLDHALTMPSLGLEHAQIEQTLADYFMHRNEWKQAMPYAMAAAQSYSGWGLNCAARCSEGLGDLDQAEEFVRACSERYESSAIDWYLWCVRTSRGDELSAKNLAERHIERLRRNPLEQPDELAIYELVEGNSAAALKLFEQTLNTGYTGSRGFHAALLADEQGEAERRDRFLKRIAGRMHDDWANAELARIMIAFLSQSENAKWNEDAFRRLLARCQGGDPTNFYYFAGRFLELHGQHEPAMRYLQWAASSPRFDKYSCLLATLALRKLNHDVPTRRPFELAGDLSDFTLVKDELTDCWTAHRFDRIVELITQSLNEHSDWNFLLADRGRALENLGKHEQAIADLELAIEQNPECQEAYHELAMIRASCEDPAFRDSAQALVHAQRAFDLSKGNTTYEDYTCLAIAYAAKGQFDKAVEQQQHALVSWPRQLRRAGMDRLKLFQDKKPYLRESRSN